MNPNKNKLSAAEQKEVIDNYFMSNQNAAEDVKKAEVLKWLQKNIMTSKLNPESIKYGIDSITMLKTREELRATMLKIEELRVKYGIDYIDSRTADSLIKMEDALNNVDFKEVFDRWVNLESFAPGIDNLLYLVTSGDL
jgi:aryl carrier-like protein